MNQSPDLQLVRQQCQEFPGQFQTLQLATCNENGMPEASYAAYVAHEGSYFIYTSELSAHTANLKHSGRCSVMFIEAEEQAKHLFARQRLTLQCTAKEWVRDSQGFESMMDQFVAKFGDFMAMMRKLTDFHLYQLKPNSGVFIAGFAQAYAVNGDNLSEIKHRKEQGHRSGDTTKSVRSQFTSLRRSGKARHRDIAAQLGLSEGQLVGAHVGAPSSDADVILHAVRLRAEWPQILTALEAVGEVMALTRNESCVHEKVGVYRNVTDHNHVGLVLGDQIDLRVFYKNWAHGFGVTEQTDNGLQRSIQFFDAQGTAIHKVFLKPQSQVAAYTELVLQYSSADQSPGIRINPKPAQQDERPDDVIDVDQFQLAWDSLKDTHDFFGLLKTFGVTRTQALRLANPKYAQKVEVEDCQRLLREAADNNVSLMVFVGNPGMIQIHSGPINKVAVMGSWVNVLDPTFNLHLREDHIASAWVVKKPTVDGLVTSLELFDSDGETIAMFFGERKPGQRERSEWRALIDSIYEEPSQCAA